MVRFSREQVIPWKSGANEVASASFLPSSTAAVTAQLVLLPTVVQAASTSEKIIGAFRPLTDLVQGLSYPISFLGLPSNFLLYMTGNRDRGLQLIKH